jgi:hypothetical protein
VDERTTGRLSAPTRNTDRSAEVRAQRLLDLLDRGRVVAVEHQVFRPTFRFNRHRNPHAMTLGSGAD